VDRHHVSNESDAGSDVVTSEPRPYLTGIKRPRIYKIEGSKCFITCGNHDLAETSSTWSWLVLKEVSGTKGISLFIVPRSGSTPTDLGEPMMSSAATSSIKWASTVPQPQPDLRGKGGCRGILLGEPHSVWQNVPDDERSPYGCGVQALGLSAAAYDTARQYAKERLQGPPFTNRRADRVPIIQHEDVRRMLMNLKAARKHAGHDRQALLSDRCGPNLTRIRKRPKRP